MNEWIESTFSFLNEPFALPLITAGVLWVFNFFLLIKREERQ